MIVSDKRGYIVRGARMYCDCGSHTRKINLPKSHGSYVDKKPMMNKGDHVVDDNISYFGICTSPENQSGDIIHLVHETNGETISGIKCCVKILKEWEKVKENTIVQGRPALTTESELVCAYHGVIRFADDGQQQEE